MDTYEGLFPKHKLDQTQFVDILIKLKENRKSADVVSYWESLKNEGNMFNILQVFEESPETQETIKSLIYSFSEFMRKDDFIKFKKMLGVHGHILEFIHAIINNPPNREIIEYFIMIAKSPRHYDPNTIQWFWEKVGPIINDDEELKKQFLENCSNSIHRWIMTQKRNKSRVYQIDSEPRYIKFEDKEIPGQLVPNLQTKRKNRDDGFKKWCRNRN